MNQFTLLSDEEFCTLVQRTYETLMKNNGATIEDAVAYLGSFAAHYKNNVWTEGDRVFGLLRSEQVLHGVTFYSTHNHSYDPDFEEQWIHNNQLAHQTRLITSLFGAPTDREFTRKMELTWRPPAGGGIVLSAERDIEVEVRTAIGMRIHDVAFKPRPEYF